MGANPFHPIIVDYLAQIADLAQDVANLAKNSALDEVTAQNIMYCAYNAHAHLVNARTKMAGADPILKFE